MGIYDITKKPRNIDPFTGVPKDLADRSGHPVTIKYATRDELVGRFNMTPEQADEIIGKRASA